MFTIFLEEREMATKVNLGCGGKTVAGWINVDYALGAKLVKLPFFRALNKASRFFEMDWDREIVIHDLRRAFPWKEESVDIIYSSHTLEHFARVDGLHFLGECHRVLKKEGIIRIIVPDLSVLISKYMKGQIRADEFVEKLGVLYNKAFDGKLKRILAPFISFPHQCMYDTKTLLMIMTDIGFQSVSKNAFESDIPDIKDIELASRANHSVIIEGRKV